MPDRKLRVFLCHASQDKPAVRELYQRLHAEDWIDPWLDEEKLLPGQDWDMEIERAVERSDAVIVLLSSNSVSREGYVQRELRYVIDVALEKPEGTIFIIPLRIDDCQIPRKLRSIHYIDYFPSIHRNRFFNRLLESLRNRRGSETPTDGIDEQHVAVGKNAHAVGDLNKQVYSLIGPKKVFVSLPRILGLLGSLFVLLSYFLPFVSQWDQLGSYKFNTAYELTFGLDPWVRYSPALGVIPVISLPIILVIIYSFIRNRLSDRIGILLGDGAVLIFITLLAHIPWLNSQTGFSLDLNIGFWVLLVGLLLILIGWIYQLFHYPLDKKNMRAFIVQRVVFYFILLTALSYLFYWADTYFG